MIIKNALLVAVAKYTGPISRVIAGVIASGIFFVATPIFAYFGMEIPEEQKAALTLSVALGVAWILTQIVAHIQKQGAEQVQETLNNITTTQVPGVEKDGFIHNKTLSALSKAVALLNKKE